MFLFGRHFHYTFEIILIFSLTWYSITVLSMIVKHTLMTIVFRLQYRLYSYCASCNFFESLFLQIKSDFTGRKSFCDFIYTSWHCHVLLTLKIKVCPATSSNSLRRLIDQIQLDHRFWQDTLNLIFISIFQNLTQSLLDLLIISPFANPDLS